MSFLERMRNAVEEANAVVPSLVTSNTRLSMTEMLAIARAEGLVGGVTGRKFVLRYYIIPSHEEKDDMLLNYLHDIIMSSHEPDKDIVF